MMNQLNKALFLLPVFLLLSGAPFMGCSKVGIDLKWPWTDQVETPPLPNEEFYEENFPLDLRKTSQGYYTTEVYVGENSYNLLVDTSLSAVVLFKDKIKAQDYYNTGFTSTIAGLTQKITGQIGYASVYAGRYGHPDLKLLLTNSGNYKNENGQAYEQVDGVLGLRHKRSAQFSTSMEVPDIPLAKITPPLNLMELNLDPDDSAHLGMGIAPLTRSAKMEYMFFSQIAGKVDASDPVNNSFTDLEPDARILNSGGVAVEAPLLLSTTLKNKLVLDENLATSLGYNRNSKTWSKNPALEVYIQSKYNALRLPVEFNTADVKVEVLSGSSDTSGYSSVPIGDVAVDITDDDETPIVQILPISEPSNVYEDSTATFSFQLDKKPTGGVLLNYYSDDPGAALLSTDGCATTNDYVLLYFDPFNYQDLQTFTVCPIDDFPTTGDRLINLIPSVFSTDGDYSALAPPAHPLTIVDDDDKYLLVSQNISETMTFTEGAGGREVRVNLSAEPSSDVYIDISSGDAAEATISLDDCATSAGSQQVIIDSTNYDSTGAAFFVCPQDDNLDDGDSSFNVTVAVNTGLTGDTGYDAATDIFIPVAVNDNDEVAITYSVSEVQLKEGDTYQYLTIALGSTPDNDVIMDITSPDPGEFEISIDDCVTPLTTETISFTAGNSYDPQTVSLCPVDDAIIDGHQILSLTPTDNGTLDSTGYAAAITGLTAISVEVVDTGEADILITEYDFTLDEDGGQAETEIFLNSVPSPDGGTTPAIMQPEGNVAIDYTTSAPDEVLLSRDHCATKVETVTIIFEPGNYYQREKFYLCPQTDGVEDGDQVFTIDGAINTELTTDETTGFDAVLPPAIVVTITDIDASAGPLFPGVTISDLNPTIIEGNTSSVTVNLDAPPNGTVIIDGTSDQPGRLLVSATNCDEAAHTVRLEFDETNWEQEVELLICPVDNTQVDGNTTANISFAVDDSGKNTDYKAAIGLAAWQKYIVGFDYTDYQGGGPEGTLFLLDRTEPYETADYYSYLPETNPNLTELGPLNTVADEKYPDITDDGAVIAFQSERPGGQGGNDVYVYNIEQGKLNLPGLNSAADDGVPSLSGDGSYIVFQSDRAGGEGGYDIYLYDIPGQTLINPPGLNSSVDDKNPDVSSDGNLLAFESDRDGDNNIYVYDLQTFSMTSLASLNTGEDERSPSLSGDGSLLAFDGYMREDGPGELDIFAYDRETNNLLGLSAFANTNTRDGGISISADGGFLAFDSSRNNPNLGGIGRDIFLYELGSGEVSFLPGLNSHFEDSAPVVSRNGEYIVFHSKRPGAVGGFDIYLYKND